MNEDEISSWLHLGALRGSSAHRAVLRAHRSGRRWRCSGGRRQSDDGRQGGHLHRAASAAWKHLEQMYRYVDEKICIYIYMCMYVDM